jgi:hypothetical protein
VIIFSFRGHNGRLAILANFYLPPPSSEIITKSQSPQKWDVTNGLLSSQERIFFHQNFLFQFFFSKKGFLHFLMHRDEDKKKNLFYNECWFVTKTHFARNHAADFMVLLDSLDLKKN